MEVKEIGSQDNNYRREGYIKFNKVFIQSKQPKNRLLLTVAYLKIYSSISGYIGLSINKLVNRIGYKPNRHDGKINKIVYNTLLDLEKEGHIYILDKFDGKNSNECFSIQINQDSDLFNTDADYVILTESEFNKIAESKTKLDKQDLLNVYLNIKKFINMSKDLYQICYPSHKKLCNDCKISSTGSMNKIIQCLIDTGVLFKYNSGQYIDSKGIPKYVNSCYAIEDGVLDQEKCDEAMKIYYSSQGISIDKFIKADNIKQ